jgi:hypothetical protein
VLRAHGLDGVVVEDAGIGLVEGRGGRFGVGKRVGWRLNGANRRDWWGGGTGCAAGREIFTGVVRGVDHGLDLVEGRQAAAGWRFAAIEEL